MRKMLAIAAIAAVTITSSLIATTGNADAQFRRWGPAVGILGAAAVTGAIIANSAPVRALRLGPPVRSVRQLHGPRLGLHRLLRFVLVTEFQVPRD